MKYARSLYIYLQLTETDCICGYSLITVVAHCGTDDVMKMAVEVREMPALHVACVRHIGPYNKIITAIEKVMKLADSQGLLNFPETKLLGVFHDDPSIVEESQLRQAPASPLQKTHTLQESSTQ